jgi:hypothetical protein
MPFGRMVADHGVARVVLEDEFVALAEAQESFSSCCTWLTVSVSVSTIPNDEFRGMGERV